MAVAWLAHFASLTSKSAVAGSGPLRDGAAEARRSRPRAAQRVGARGHHVGWAALAASRSSGLVGIK